MLVESSISDIQVGKNSLVVLHPITDVHHILLWIKKELKR